MNLDAYDYEAFRDLTHEALSTFALSRKRYRYGVWSRWFYLGSFYPLRNPDDRPTFGDVLNALESIGWETTKGWRKAKYPNTRARLFRHPLALLYVKTHDYTGMVFDVTMRARTEKDAPWT